MEQTSYGLGIDNIGNHESPLVRKHLKKFDEVDIKPYSDVSIFQD